jgi:hypothetical protein
MSQHSDTFSSQSHIESQTFHIIIYCGISILSSQKLLATVGFTRHHLPALIYSFFGGKKNIKFLLPATTIENISRANLFRKPSNSSILMAINAIDAIFSDQVNP